jgi:hypothetical protein
VPPAASSGHRRPLPATGGLFRPLPPRVTTLIVVVFPFYFPKLGDFAENIQGNDHNVSMEGMIPPKQPTNKGARHGTM